MSHIPQDFRPPPSLDAIHHELGVNDPHRGLQTDDPVLPTRPTGIALIAAWHFVSALLLLMVGLREFGAAVPAWPDVPVGGIAPFYLVALPFNLILGAGLWELARWARYFAIVTSFVAIVLRFAGGTPSTLDVLLATISAAIIYYLLRPSTRALFERPSS